jgi:hypothetical protein
VFLVVGDGEGADVFLVGEEVGCKIVAESLSRNNEGIIDEIESTPRADLGVYCKA